MSEPSADPDDKHTAIGTLFPLLKLWVPVDHRQMVRQPPAFAV